MKTISDMRLGMGELLEVRCSYLYGSAEEKAFRNSLVAHFGSKFLDLIGYAHRKEPWAIPNSFGRMGRILRSANVGLSPSCRVAVEILNSSAADKVVLFSLLGLGEDSVRLLSEIIRFSKIKGLRFILMNYSDNGEFESMRDFSPISTKLLLAKRLPINRFEFEFVALETSDFI